MRPRLTLVALLCAAATLISAAPAPAANGDLRAAVKAPDSIPPGRLVRLEATLVRERDHLREELAPSGEDAPRFAWRLVAPPDGYEIDRWTFDAGRTVVFAAAEPGAYRFVLAAAVPDSAGGPPQLVLAEHTLIVTGAPTPSPHPEPGPSLPEGTFGLARMVYDLARAEVPVASRNDALSLAENYRAVAARIVAGTLAEPDAILAATAEDNRAALGAGVEVWRPFFAALAARMKSLDAAGRLAEPADYATAWNEISAGLGALR